MQRPRKEILTQVDAVHEHNEWKYFEYREFFSEGVQQAFYPQLDVSYEKLASTYDKTVDQYFDNEWKYFEYKGPVC